MKDNPAERYRRSEPLLRRSESTLLLVIAFALFAVIAFGRQADGFVRSDVSTLKEPAGSTWPAIFAALLFILLNAAFILVENAVALLRPSQIRLYKDKPAIANKLEDLLARQAEVIASCSFGSQLMRVALVFMGMVVAVAAASLAEDMLGWPFTYATILGGVAAVGIPIFLLNLILGELVPKSYATLYPAPTAARLAGFARFSSVVFKYPARLVVGIANLFAARFGGKATLNDPLRAEEEIITLVETAQETGAIETDESELIQSVFEFTDTVAREIMTPRTDLDAMPIDSDPEEVVKVIQTSGHSRIPLYEGTDDQIIGIIHAKDLLLSMVKESTPSMRRLMRPAMFIPENKNLHELLAEMRAARAQLAIVQDEMGGTAGIVTIEDIVEELFGDIQDEYDQEEPEVSEHAGGYLVEGKTHLDDVNDEIGSEFHSDDFDTIGGYVFGLFGRQPKLGEFLDADGHRFTVAETDGRRIQRLRIQKLEETESLGVENGRVSEVSATS